MGQDQSKERPFVFTIERRFDAPRERVWRAWTDPEQLKHWFGPKGCTVTYCAVDLRPGGAARYCIEFNGATMWGKWTYREIQAPEKLVAVVAFTDESGETIVEHPASPGWPLEILSTVTFSESGGGTRVTIEWTAHDAPAAQRRTFEDGAPGMRQGWGGSLERLDELLGE